MKFICDIGTVQTYLEKWGQISAKPLPKFWEKVGERREKWCDGCGERERNFGNDIAQNFFFFELPKLEDEKKKKKRKRKLNCGKSNVTTTH